MSSFRARIIKEPQSAGEQIATFGLDEIRENAAPSPHGAEEFQRLFAAGAQEKREFIKTSFTDMSAPAAVNEVPQTSAEPETEPATQLEPLPVVADSPVSGAVMEEELDKKIHEAFSSGLEEGKLQAEEGLSALCGMLSAAADELRLLHERIMRQTEDDLLKLAISVAKRVILQEVTHDRGILRNVVSEAIKNISDKDEIVIRLNPEDYRVVSANSRNFLPEMSEKRHLTLKPDEEVSSGGCVVDTAMGSIDARVEAQLDEIYRRLTEERGPAEAAGLGPLTGVEP